MSNTEQKQKILLKRTTEVNKPSIPSGASHGELFLNIASGANAHNKISTMQIGTNNPIIWSDDVANEKKFALKTEVEALVKEVEDNELVTATAISTMNASAGFNEDGSSVLEGGVSLSQAIIDLQARAGVIEESDPIFAKSAASGITSADITNWNNKMDFVDRVSSAFTSYSATTAASVVFSGIPTGKTNTTVARGDHSHTVAEIGGLESALKYHGVTTTPLTDGATTKPITIGGVSHYQSAGCVVIYTTTASGDTEFVWNGSSWEKLGDGINYKVKQEAVSDPAANGSALSFIDTISQDTNGVIKPTKKSVNLANYSLTSHTHNASAITGGTFDTGRIPTGITVSKAISATTSVSATTAVSATKLATPRSIWGQSFDGTRDITGHLWSDTWRIITDATFDGTFFQSKNYDGTSNAGNIYFTGWDVNALDSFNVRAKNSYFSNNIKASGNINATSITINGTAVQPLYLKSNQSNCGILFFNSNNNATLMYSGGSNWRVTDNGWSNAYYLLHSGNIGNYKAGDSAKLDGYLPSSFYVGTRGHIKSGDDLSALAPGGYYVGAAVNSTNPLPTDYASLSVLGNNYYSSQLCVKHDSTRAWIRGTYPNKKEVSNWHELAFTDSNVASATKLQTPRKLWGNDFDGTADVSGLMYVGNEFHIEHPTTGRQLGISSYWTILGYNNPMIGNPTYIDGRNVYIRYGNDEYASVFASNGNVGIGTTSPTERLDVSGNIKASGNITANSFIGNADSATTANSATTATSATTAKSASTVYATSGSGTYYLLGHNSSSNGNYSVYKNSNVYMNNGSIFAASDRTLKTHIEDIDGSLDKIKKIPKVYFHWNNDEDKKRQMGTYAQDLEEVYPELVTKDKDGIRAVAYDRLGVVALAGIDKLYDMVQELMKKNDELEKRIKELEENK